MKSLFVIHASIWDMILLGFGAVFVGAYFVIWALEARRQARKK